MKYKVTFNPLSHSREMKAVIKVEAEQEDEAITIAEWRLENLYSPIRKRSNFRKQVQVVDITELKPVVVNQELIA